MKLRLKKCQDIRIYFIKNLSLVQTSQKLNKVRIFYLEITIIIMLIYNKIDISLNKHKLKKTIKIY